MIYIASPYSGNEEENFLRAERYTADCLRAGHMVYSPIVHNHALAQKFSLPTDFIFWKQHNQAILAKATRLVVLSLPGWEKSRGVTEEIAFARECGIPVEFCGMGELPS